MSVFHRTIIAQHRRIQELELQLRMTEGRYVVAIVDTDVALGPFDDRQHANMYAVLNLGEKISYEILQLTPPSPTPIATKRDL